MKQLLQVLKNLLFKERGPKEEKSSEKKEWNYSSQLDSL
jgi:hypothetical protein